MTREIKIPCEEVNSPKESRRKNACKHNEPVNVFSLILAPKNLMYATLRYVI